MKQLILFLCILIISVSNVKAQRIPDNQKVLQLYEDQRFAEAASYLESFYEDATANKKLISSLAYSFRMAKDFPKATLYYTKLYELDTLNVNTLAVLAAINQQRGQQNAAKDLYQKILLVDSTYIDAYVALAGFAKRDMDNASAFNYLSIANRLSPNDSDVASNFADVCVSEEKLGRADTVLSVALKHDPEHAGLLYSKAKVADELKNYWEVIILTRKLIDLEEGGKSVWTLLAKAHFYQKSYDLTMSTYEEAMGKYKGWGEVDYYFMASACQELKRLDESLSYIEKALKEAISPNTGFYFTKKAGILKDLGKPSAAASAYIRSFQYQDDAIEYFNLAVLYDRELNSKANALKYYKHYLSKEPKVEDKTYIEYAQKRIDELKVE